MKIHIVNNNDVAIEGYKTIIFNNLDNEFVELSNNSCEFILANNIFDYCESKYIPEIIQKLLTKLRLNGKMVIGGKDINLFCKSVKNHLISEQEASDVIANIKSLIGYQSVENIIKQLNLKYTTQLNGIDYVITASRQ